MIPDPTRDLSPVFSHCEVTFPMDWTDMMAKNTMRASFKIGE